MVRSLTSSMPIISPLPRISPMTGYCNCNSRRCFMKWAPTLSALAAYSRSIKVECHQRGRATERIAAVSVRMRAGLPLLHDGFFSHDQADRESGAKALGQRHDVGLHIPVLTGEHLAAAADAGLHFIENQQNSGSPNFRPARQIGHGRFRRRFRCVCRPARPANATARVVLTRPRATEPNRDEIIADYCDDNSEKEMFHRAM